jgi:hypothetical protein
LPRGPEHLNFRRSKFRRDDEKTLQGIDDRATEG